MASDAPPQLPDSLWALSRSLNSNRQLLELLEQLALSAAALTASDHAEVILSDPVTRKLIGNGSARVHFLEAEDEATRWVTEQRRALVMPNLNFASSDSDLELQTQGIESYLGVPIMDESTTFGALIAFSGRVRSYEEGEQANLEIIANLASVIISYRKRAHDLNEARRTLLKLSMMDPGTGMASKAQFTYMLRREWRRSTSEGLPISLLHLEIDAFEEFVEKHGLGQAMRLLTRAADIVDAALYRTGDLAARIDDTILVVLLPDTDLAGAKSIADRLRREISAAAPRLNGIPLTLSVGITSLDTLSRRNEVIRTPTMLYDLASEALRKAKEAGGNRVLTIS